MNYGDYGIDDTHPTGTVDHMIEIVLELAWRLSNENSTSERQPKSPAWPSGRASPIAWWVGNENTPIQNGGGEEINTKNDVGSALGNLIDSFKVESKGGTTVTSKYNRIKK